MHHPFSNFFHIPFLSSYFLWRKYACAIAFLVNSWFLLSCSTQLNMRFKTQEIFSMNRETDRQLSWIMITNCGWWNSKMTLKWQLPYGSPALQEWVAPVSVMGNYSHDQALLSGTVDFKRGTWPRWAFNLMSPWKAVFPLAYGREKLEIQSWEGFHTLLLAWGWRRPSERTQERPPVAERNPQWAARKKTRPQSYSHKELNSASNRSKEEWVGSRFFPNLKISV